MSSSGDPKPEFSEIVAANLRRFQFLARAYSEGAEAQDLLQEILLQVWQSLASFRGNAGIDTWVYRVALNGRIVRRKIYGTITLVLSAAFFVLIAWGAYRMNVPRLAIGGLLIFVATCLIGIVALREPVARKRGIHGSVTAGNTERRDGIPPFGELACGFPRRHDWRR